MNALTTTGRSATTNLQILLPSNLVATVQRVLQDQSSYSDLPILRPDQRAAIPGAVEAVERALIGATPDQVLEVLATLNVVLPKRQNEENAKQAAKLYALALADIPPDILNAAAVEAIKTLTFFPKVAELRKLAMPEFCRRKAILFRLQMLAKKFDHEYRPPIEDPVRPEDLARLHKGLERRFPSRRKVTA